MALFKHILIVSILLLFTMCSIAGESTQDYKVWKSKDGHLEIKGKLFANPMVDGSNLIKIIIIGDPASFLHTDNSSEVKGKAHLILYYPDSKHLELHGSVHLSQNKDNYYGQKAIYDLKLQHIVKPKRDKYLIKPVGKVEPNKQHHPTRHRCAVPLGCV